jgi:bifunctional UDP-N-acetylglucosamine pyrophosphorylase/glucosamine-1-phosphate N-acetyltransferase
MKSRMAKVLHTVCGKPMICWVVEALEDLRSRGLVDRILVVTGRDAERVEEAVGSGAVFVRQEERRGTAHAVMQAADLLEEELLLVVTGDSPLIRPGTLAELFRVHRETDAWVTLLTARLEDPTGYGRIIRDLQGAVVGVVEEGDANPEERAIKEVNTSTYLFLWERLREVLPRIRPDNAKGEFYLTDAVRLMAEAGGVISTVEAADPTEVLGINDRLHLAQAERMMRERILRRLMEEGVTVEDPATAYVGPEVKVGRDTTIRPFVILEGKTVIGEDCLVGPGVRIVDSVLGRGVRVEQAVLRECVVEDGVSIGPFASLRPGTHLMEGSKIGTFVETKKTVVGRGSKIPHLSYMGDAHIGSNVNVGAGSITCNYDGVSKHPTVIEDDAFIGSDTMFIAPVRVGRGAVTGAGSAISQDVPPGALGIERSRQRNIPGWRNKKSEVGDGTEGDNQEKVDDIQR